ncbi:hypothetical protein OH77DRAFT_1514255 [Trametes cingulata]|nr:hypothetical protein OH77DRAFT_1514255 [Trametes cingulata]
MLEEDDLEGLLTIQQPSSPLPSSSPLSSPPSSPTPGSRLQSWTELRRNCVAAPATPSRHPAPDHSSDPGVVCSSPVVATASETLQEVRRRKGQKKRLRTLASQTEARQDALREEAVASAQAVHEARAHAEHEADIARRRCFESALSELSRGGQTWGDLVEFISDPQSKMKTVRYEGMFRATGQLERILDLWALKNSRSGKRRVHSWTLHSMSQVVSREADRATYTGVLQSRRMVVSEAFVLGFNLTDIHEKLREICPTMSSLMHSFSTTRRQAMEQEQGTQTASEDALLRKRAVQKAKASLNRVGAAMTDLLGERSQNNSYVKHVLGLYLYATGAQRQIISVLSNLGFCSSYPSIAGSRGSMQTEGVSEDASEELSVEAKDAGVGTGEGSSTATAQMDGDDSDEDDDPDWLEDAPDNQEDEQDEREVDGNSEDGEDDREQDEGHTTGESVPASEKPHGNVEGGSEAPASGFPLLHRGAGLLRRISSACRRATRCCAHSSLCGHVYDNINMVFKIAEQILGRKDSQENGTCATIFRLFEARPEDMQTSDLLNTFDKAPPLVVKDILHTPAEAQLFQKSLEHTVLRIIVNSSDAFAHFQPRLSECLPDKEDAIPLHQTEVHPLPAMNIDESSVTGNADVMDCVFKELGFDVGTTKFSGLVRPVFGDQLSIARLRTLISNRAGHESLANSYSHLVFGPGFFHHQMALTHGIIETHWGDPASGTRNPASLSFFNIVLDRKPIVLTSLPPYRTCRDLIFTSLSGCVLRCLELVSGCDDLDEYAGKITFAELQGHAAAILKSFGSSAEVSKLRRQREAEKAAQGSQGTSASATPSAATSTTTTSSLTQPPRPANSPLSSSSLLEPGSTHADPIQGGQRSPSDAPDSASASPPAPQATQHHEGDMVHENACLFLRDALILREFTDAIKGGYSGRIIRVLKILVLMYRGSGRSKYAHELLHLVHNLTHVWPKPLREIMIKNWLVNPTGKANSWVPVDLLQEHMNYWIKIIYKAQGSNASWEWLQNISPCVMLLRTLATQVNRSLGARLGTRHHSPQLHRDISAIRDKLRMHNVYGVEPGRIIEGENREVPNVVTTGLNQLPGPLSDYNRMFTQLQRRRRMTPLADTPLTDGLDATTQSASERDSVVSLSGTTHHGENLQIPMNTAEPSAAVADVSKPSASLYDEADEELWQQFDDDNYEPRDFFAEEDDPSLDLDDF